jgi:hypothetical protein
MAASLKNHFLLLITLIAMGLAKSELTAANSDETLAPLKVFILAGQSNMRGLGNPKDLPQVLQRKQPRVILFQACQADNGLPAHVWIPLQPGSSFGPEIGFGSSITIGYPKQQIGLIKLGIDGTSIGSWSNTGYYKQLMDLIKECSKTRKIDITGVVWMQGESDAMTQRLADSYQKNLMTLIAKLRADCKKPALPFVCGRISSSLPPTHFPYLQTVRTAQDLSKSERAIMVDTDDLPTYDDDVHFTGKGQLILGHRFALAMFPTQSAPEINHSTSK